MDISQARQEIDEIDLQMAQLFSRRMEAVIKVANYKKANNLPILDEKREEEVVQKNLLCIDNNELSQFYEAFIRSNMSISRAYQKKLLSIDTVAYQGIEGAYSHITLQRLYPYATQLACSTWEAVFAAVENGTALNGVLPLENSFAGDVSEVLDLCFAHKCCVHGIYDLPIKHCLLGIEGASLSDVKTVYSHPQALSQCKKFTDSLSLELNSAANTAMAAKYVVDAGDKTIAAIASVETAQLYGLKTLAQNINTSGGNTTRFIIIGKELLQTGNRCSLLFTVPHVAGSLAEAIMFIGKSGFNMENIKSRPIPGRSWEYYFYSEIIGNIDGESGKKLIEGLKGVCQSVRLLGIYNKLSLEQQFK